MKKIFVAMLALAAAAACSNEEIVSVNREAIAFDNAFVNNATRSEFDPGFDANDLKGENVGFGVYGFVTGNPNDAANTTAPIFTNERVTWNSTENAWKHNTVQYWINGATYNFVAIAPYSDSTINSGMWTATVANNTTTLNYKASGGDTDLLYAATPVENVTAGYNTAVSFNFRHILSKVKFTFNNAYDATNTKIAVRTILVKAPTKADATLTANSTVWNNHSENGIYDFFSAGTELSSGSVVPAKLANGESVQSFNELLLIPYATDITYPVTFYVDLYIVNGNTETLVKTFEHTHYLTVKFQPGYSYNVSVAINADNIDPAGAQKPIEFTVDEYSNWGWTPANPGTFM